MKILVIPDVHGRTFWMCANHLVNDVDKIVFLGDYIDPYDFEHHSQISTISNFEKIIDFKKSNMDKVVLLLGNHDLPYYFKKRGVCRYMSAKAKKLEKLFEGNRELFTLAYETDDTLFTHAGVLNHWIELVNRFCNIGLTATADSLNSLLTRKEGYDILNMIPRERGGNYSYGSCVWCDFDEHQYDFGYNGKYQVFGHTLQLDTYYYYFSNNDSDIKDGQEKIIETKSHVTHDNKVIQVQGYAMLDCRHAFLYNEKDEEKKFIKL